MVTDATEQVPDTQVPPSDNGAAAPPVEEDKPAVEGSPQVPPDAEALRVWYQDQLAKEREEVRREAQAERDRWFARQRQQAQRQEEEQRIIAARDTALQKLRDDPSSATAEAYAEAKARADYYPDMRDDLFRVPKRVAELEGMTPAEQEEFEERQDTWARQVEHSVQIAVKSAVRLAVEAEQKKFAAERTRLLAEAEEVGRRKTLTEQRPGAPPPTAGGSPGTGLTWEHFSALPIEERAKFTDAERGQMYQEHLRRIRGR